MKYLTITFIITFLITGSCFAIPQRVQNKRQLREKIEIKKIKEDTNLQISPEEIDKLCSIRDYKKYLKKLVRIINKLMEIVEE